MGRVVLLLSNRAKMGCCLDEVGSGIKTLDGSLSHPLALVVVTMDNTVLLLVIVVVVMVVDDVDVETVMEGIWERRAGADRDRFDADDTMVVVAI